MDVIHLYQSQNGLLVDYTFKSIPRHFSLYKESKLRGLQCKCRYGAVKSSQLSCAGQYKKCVQYDFKFTSECSVFEAEYYLVLYISTLFKAEYYFFLYYFYFV